MRSFARSLLLLLHLAAPAYANALLDRSAEAMGLEALRKAGALQLAYAGHLYGAADAQASIEPRQAVDETFAWDLSRNAYGWESRGLRADGSVRWRRFLYPEPDVLLRADLTEKWAGAIRSPAYRLERLRAARLLPQFVLSEARERMATVRPLESRAISYATPAGDVFNLRFDDQHRLARVETWLAVPFVGDRLYAWEYSAWRLERQVAIPGRVRILIGDQLARDLTLQSVAWAPAIFTIPADFQKFPERKGPDVLPDAALGGTAEQVAAGIWFVANVTSNTNAMFIDHEDGITVLEAPAGALYPQTELPPPNLVRGAQSSAPGEALVDLIHRTLPGRPIRRAVITHPHADHAGGVRALAAEGAEIIATNGAAEQIRRFLQERFILEPDRYERRRHQLKPVVRGISERTSIGSGQRRAEVMRADQNPHIAEMLVIWIPAERLLFQGDLFYPEPLERFPSPNRAPIMKWFANWLEERGIDPERIYSAHGEIPATPEHLQRLRAAP